MGLYASYDGTVFEEERHPEGKHILCGFKPAKGFPELLTEEELVAYLRIPAVSNSKDYHNVIEHLKRLMNLPRIHICNKTLYPKKAVQEWIERETVNGK